MSCPSVGVVVCLARMNCDFDAHSASGIPDRLAVCDTAILALSRGGHRDADARSASDANRLTAQTDRQTDRQFKCVATFEPTVVPAVCPHAPDLSILRRDMCMVHGPPVMGAW